MPKDKKEPITRDSCEKELYFLNGADIRYRLVLFLGQSLILVPLLFLAFSLLDESGAEKMLGIFMCCTGLILGGILLGSFIKSLYERKLLKSGAFSVVTDTVVRLSVQRGIYWYSRGTPTLYFSQYGSYQVNQSTYDYTVCGDTFYLLIYHTKRPTVKKIYSTGIYEWKE